MSSILWTATSNHSLSAMIKWDGLKFSPRIQPGFFTLSLPDSRLPSHSWLWFSSIPFLPHPTLPILPLTLLSVTLFFPQTFELDLYPGHVACPLPMPCLQHEAHAHLKHFCLGHSESYQSRGKEAQAHLSGIWGRDFLRCGRLKRRCGERSLMVRFYYFWGSTGSNT